MMTVGPETVRFFFFFFPPVWNDRKGTETASTALSAFTGSRFRCSHIVPKFNNAVTIKCLRLVLVSMNHRAGGGKKTRICVRIRTGPRTGSRPAPSPCPLLHISFKIHSWSFNYPVKWWMI